MSRYCKSLTGIAVCPCFKGKCPENKHTVEGFFKISTEHTHSLVVIQEQVCVVCESVCLYMFSSDFEICWVYQLVGSVIYWRRKKIPRFVRRNKLINKPRENCIVPESFLMTYGEGFCWTCISCCHKSEVSKNAIADGRNAWLTAQVPSLVALVTGSLLHMQMK